MAWHVLDCRHDAGRSGKEIEMIRSFIRFVVALFIVAFMAALITDQFNFSGALGWVFRLLVTFLAVGILLILVLARKVMR